MTLLPGLVDGRRGDDRRRRDDCRRCDYRGLRHHDRRRGRGEDVRDGLHDSCRDVKAAGVMLVVVMAGRGRRRWRTVVRDVVVSCGARYVVHRRRAASAMVVVYGSRACIGCRRDCESAREGYEKVLVVHITPDFLF